MPKIIENLDTMLIAEAKRQVETSGYSSMTIRSVASACGVGVGTVYNYFSTKDDLLASYLLAEWEACLAAINAVSVDSDAPDPVIRCIYDQLRAFSHRHKAIFSDPAAIASFAGSFKHYHIALRQQLAVSLRKFCPHDFAAEFIAEAVFRWTLAGKEFEEIFEMVSKLF